ncbi:TPA: sigma-70 family RNA polymerase sigma factor [Candidatus Avacholeplasma faecigallinarum]|nr:sigma-70 family RNA polymerase sigma factor [Candidatus Avacholeplasma faecigallinarum]
MQDEERIKELFRHLKNNELNYFDEFYNLTKQSVFYMAYSILKNSDLCEDILQETYLKFLKHINRIHLEKSIIGYLLKISKNLSLNLLKKRSRETVMEFDNVCDNDTKEQDNFELLEKISQILKPQEFQIVVLHVINGLTHKEIAKITKRPLGSITWAYNNAMAKVRRELQNED